MKVEKPSIPKGTRDFSPVEVARREYIFEVIRNVYQKHGFMPIETPAMEQLSTLMGKYGEEGDRLIFRILNSGDFPTKVPDSEWQAKEAQVLSAKICEKALRYDLTVPFARYVSQYQHQINFPFKRYQIQPVWRADRPQKGRYREFFQCDADVIGSDSLLNEAELVQMIDEVFTVLHIPVVVKLNNRKILAGLAGYVGFADQLTDITTAMDKLDKTGLENVNLELLDKGLSRDAVDKLQPVLSFSGSDTQKLALLHDILQSSAVGLKGLEEMKETLELIALLPLQARLEFDLTLARGLNYYTGAIIEVKAQEAGMGSICGGGRYDDLTGIFGLPGVSGVGISFGADRIYDVLNTRQGFPKKLGTFTQMLAVNFGPAEARHCIPLLSSLREKGIHCELYPDAVKMKKQMQYADKNQIPFVLIAGEKEIAEGKYTLKNMLTGEQQLLAASDIPGMILKEV
jgi:histidyl-tRNA synthetase